MLKLMTLVGYLHCANSAWRAQAHHGSRMIRCLEIFHCVQPDITDTTGPILNELVSAHLRGSHDIFFADPMLGTLRIACGRFFDSGLVCRGFRNFKNDLLHVLDQFFAGFHVSTSYHYPFMTANQVLIQKFSGIRRPAGFPKPRRSAARLYLKIHAWLFI